MDSMEEYETVLLVKHEVFVYKIPPRTTNRGYRAADWNLQTPDWTGRMRLVAKGSGKECVMKLEDKTSGELFAKCPIEKYPGIGVEAVADSSRYFVIRIQDDNDACVAGRAAFIGLGFADRGDSFDLNVALQDHFKWVEKSEEIEQEDKEPTKPQLDLSLKEGQMITINMKIGKSGGTSRPKAKGTGTGILPPPPGGGGRLAPPPGSRSASSSVSSGGTTPSPTQESTSPVQPLTQSHNSHAPSNLDLLVDFGASTAPAAAVSQASNFSTELWGEFSSAKASISNLPASGGVGGGGGGGGGDWMAF